MRHSSGSWRGRAAARPVRADGRPLRGSFCRSRSAIAGAAWAISGDSVRALSVLVVATPCPLILAAPIAFVAGLSRAARIGVIVKGGEAIERLGDARTVVLDKTGTLTLGMPAVERVVVLDGVARGELLRLAARWISSQPRARRAIVREASARGSRSRGRAGERVAGPGNRGHVEGRRVVVGSPRGSPSTASRTGEPALPRAVDGNALVLVGVERAARGRAA